MEAVGDQMCLQLILYFEDLLLPQFSILTCQDFHQIEFFLCKHPYMESQARPSMDLEIENYDC